MFGRRLNLRVDSWRRVEYHQHTDVMTFCGPPPVLRRRAMRVNFPGPRLYDVAHRSRTRYARVTARPAVRALLPMKCPAGDAMSALPATEQA